MAVREAFKDISELFLLQQYGADEQQKKVCQWLFWLASWVSQADCLSEIEADNQGVDDCDKDIV